MAMVSGQRYGRLTAVSFVRRDARYQHYWLFRCDCGKEKVILISSVTRRRQDAQSCGCMAPQVWSAKKTHGMTGTPEYIAWNDMRNRCENPNLRSFKDYGARGIKVCDRWRESFENFYSDMGPRPEGMSLDRIDNDGNYEPGNCRWAERKVQSRNVRTRRTIVYGGQEMTLAEAAEVSGVNKRTLTGRLNRGWDVARAMQAPDKSTR